MFLPASPTLLLGSASSLPPHQPSLCPCWGSLGPVPLGRHLHSAGEGLILLAAIFSFFLTTAHVLAQFTSRGLVVSNPREGSQRDPDPTGEGPAVGHWWDWGTLPRDWPCTAGRPRSLRRQGLSNHPHLSQGEDTGVLHTSICDQTAAGAGRVPAGHRIPTGRLEMADRLKVGHAKRRRQQRESKPRLTSLKQEPSLHLLTRGRAARAQGAIPGTAPRGERGGSALPAPGTPSPGSGGSFARHPSSLGFSPGQGLSSALCKYYCGLARPAAISCA